MNKDINTISNKELLDIYAGLQHLSSEKTKAWYKISLNMKTVEPFVTKLFNLKDGIIDKYAKRDDKGNFIILERTEKGEIIDLGENEKIVNKLWLELLNESVKINFALINISDLNDVSLNPLIIKPLLGVVIAE